MAGVVLLALPVTAQLRCGRPGVRCNDVGKIVSVRWLADDGGVGCGSGTVPREIGTMSPSLIEDLEELQIGHNNQSFPRFWVVGTRCALSGTLPTEIGRLTKLRIINLWAMGATVGISGTVPTEVGKLRLLERLDMDGRESGTLPSELGNLGRLKSLSLEGSGPLPSKRLVSGTLPSEWAGLTSLDRVYLGMNEISGTIPSAYGRNWQEVSWMELFGNKLSGTIPPQVGQMESLGALHLHGNPISGSIPEQLGQLSH